MQQLEGQQDNHLLVNEAEEGQANDLQQDAAVIGEGEDAQVNALQHDGAAGVGEGENEQEYAHQQHDNLVEQDVRVQNAEENKIDAHNVGNEGEGFHEAEGEEAEGEEFEERDVSSDEGGINPIDVHSTKSKEWLCSKQEKNYMLNKIDKLTSIIGFYKSHNEQLKHNCNKFLNDQKISLDKIKLQNQEIEEKQDEILALKSKNLELEEQLANLSIEFVEKS